MKLTSAGTIFSISTAVLIAVLAYMWYQDAFHPYVCVQTSTVKTILSINYRDATILLENGETKVVNQAKLAPGDKFCLKTEQK